MSSDYCTFDIYEGARRNVTEYSTFWLKTSAIELPKVNANFPSRLWLGEIFIHVKDYDKF